MGRYKYQEFMGALALMLPGDPPLIWDVPSARVGQNYAWNWAKTNGWTVTARAINDTRVEVRRLK